MNRSNRLLPVLAGVMSVSLISTTCAQTWESSDAITYPTAGPSAQVDAIAAAPDGTVYALGASLASSGGFEANYVRRSFDAGTTWQSVASFSPVTGNGINKLVVDSAGRLYAAGLFGGVWTTFRSEDHGVTWSVIDSFSTGANSYPEVRGIATDANGNVYVAGSAIPSRSPRQWLVRKGVPNLSAPNGISWTTIDVFTPGKNYGAFACAVATRAASAGPAEIYVGGTAGSSGGVRWTVRRSTDGGATWATIDSFASDHEGLKTLALSADGSIFTSGLTRTITGGKNNQTTTYSCVVRKGVPVSGGFSWSTKESISSSTFPANLFRPASSTVDASDRLFIAGYEIVNNAEIWRVRTSFDGGQTFGISDSFASGVAFTITADPAGNVFTGGYFGTDISNGGGIIRRLPAPIE
jgi:hypothetical protein